MHPLTRRLLEKVAEAQRAARARAERFGVEYVEPKLSVILSREEYRKYMSGAEIHGAQTCDFDLTACACR